MKFIFSLLVAIFVGSFTCSAADLDSVDFYSFDSLSPMTASALDYAVMPLAATSWDTADQAHLAAIRNALTFASTTSGGSVFGWVQLMGQSFKDGLFTDILDEIGLVNDGLRLNVSANEGSFIDTVRDIETLLDTLNRVTVPAGNLYLDEINDAIQNDTYSLKGLLQSIWVDTGDILNDTGSILSVLNSNLPSMNSDLHRFMAYFLDQIWSRPVVSLDNQVTMDAYQYKFFSAYGDSLINLSYDGLTYAFRDKTLYSRIKQLQEVLASDADLALSQSQEANREEIEDSFLTGSSGSTSLGVSDFAGLSDVGGSVRDSLSLDGNASLTSFTSGLSAADSAGQGWFSETTRSQLDTVSATVTYSLRDPDPYNMDRWADRYYWLIGDDK